MRALRGPFQEACDKFVIVPGYPSFTPEEVNYFTNAHTEEGVVTVSMELPRLQGCHVGSDLTDKKLGRMVPSRMCERNGLRGNWRVMGMNDSEVRGEV